MGLFGWGDKDQTTKPERDAWKANAKEQMNGGKPAKDKTKDDGKPPRHANKSSWW